MRNLLSYAAALAVSGGLAFSAGATADEVLANVNGTKIKQSDVDSYVRDTGNSGRGERAPEQVIEELISRELVYQDAMKQKLEKQPQVQRQMKLLRRNVLMNAALQKAVEDKPITDAELRSAYDQQVKHFSQQEYQASHILLKSEEDAQKVIKALDDGGDFVALAKKHSTGPTGRNGGDLGWFAPQQMVPPFAQAVAALKKGSYTKKPVKTQFGWHVIQLRDVRAMEPPAFERVKPQIEQGLQQERIRNYLDKLRANAKVEIK